MPKHSNKRPRTSAEPSGWPRFIPSPELAAVIGADPVTRQAATAAIWTHIKAAGLQKADDKRRILADDRLRPVFGRDEIGMFDLAGALSRHLIAGTAVAAA